MYLCTHASLPPHLSMHASLQMGDGRLVKPASGALAAACARLQRRLSSSCAELLYMTDGDKNGALYYIATGYGSRPWRNPALDGLVEVRASSPASRFTDPRAVVGRKYLNTSHAGGGEGRGGMVMLMEATRVVSLHARL